MVFCNWRNEQGLRMAGMSTHVTEDRSLATTRAQEAADPARARRPPRCDCSPRKGSTRPRWKSWPRTRKSPARAPSPAPSWPRRPLGQDEAEAELWTAYLTALEDGELPGPSSPNSIGTPAAAAAGLDRSAGTFSASSPPAVAHRQPSPPCSGTPSTTARRSGEQIAATSRPGVFSASTPEDLRLHVPRRTGHDRMEPVRPRLVRRGGEGRAPRPPRRLRRRHRRRPRPASAFTAPALGRDGHAHWRGASQRGVDPGVLPPSGLARRTCRVSGVLSPGVPVDRHRGKPQRQLVGVHHHAPGARGPAPRCRRAPAAAR